MKSFAPIIIAVLAGAAAAPLSAGIPEAYGTTDETILVIPASAFTSPTGATFTLDPSSGAGEVVASAAGENYWAPVQLPSGALVTSIALNFCWPGTEPVQGSLILNFNRYTTSLDANVNTGVDRLASIDPAVPSNACTLAVNTLTTPVTIDNTTTTGTPGSSPGGAYGLSLTYGPSFARVRFLAAELRYKRQVSPGPGTATFGDVPTTSPYFKFVEALVAAGITSGCGGGNYCPASPVTRGQMAVFLASALGMLFPN